MRSSQQLKQRAASTSREAPSTVALTPPRQPPLVSRTPVRDPPQGNTTPDDEEKTVTVNNQLDDNSPENLHQVVYLFPPRLFTGRYEARLKLEESEDPALETATKLRAFLKKLQESDNSLVMYPWKEDYNKGSVNSRKHKALQKAINLSSQPGGWKVYFDRANPVAKGGWTYPSIFLGHNKPFDTIMDDVKWWLQTYKHGWYQRQLQCDLSCMFGWALYSVQNMNANMFWHALTTQLGIDIGDRWRTIALPKAGSARKEHLAKALHFEVDVSHRVQATRGLRKIYGSQSLSFPLSVKLRFVPVSSATMNLKTREKAESFRLRQLQFCTHMVAMRSWEILSLDTLDSSGLPTIRERINTLPSTTMPGIDLFHTIDRSFQEGAVVFTFHPDREEEARAMVIGLIPYLKWQATTGLGHLSRAETDSLHSKYVYRYFSQEAIDRSHGAVWNTDTNCVESPNNREVDALDEVDPGFDLSSFVTVNTDDATVNADE